MNKAEANINFRTVVLSLVVFLATVALGIIDFLTGPDLSLSLFYLVAILAATWLVGRWAGISASVAAAMTWFAANILFGHSRIGLLGHPQIESPVAYWNVFAELTIFLIATFLLSAFKDMLDREKSLARTDYNTGIPNGRYFIELTKMEVMRAERYGEPLTIAMMDVDNFKAINDQHGHDVGDRFLRSVAHALQGSIREVDFAGRMGGDEFAVLLPNTAEKGARVVFEKIRNDLKEIADKNNWPVTYSIGVATYIDIKGGADDLIKQADVLLYKAKKAGKNTTKYKVIKEKD